MCERHVTFRFPVFVFYGVSKLCPAVAPALRGRRNLAPERLKHTLAASRATIAIDAASVI